MLVNYVVMLTVLLGCCALALDIGMFELKRLQLQNAADAAALSGMQELDRNNTSSWTAIAAADSAQNGFTQGLNGTNISMTSAPAGYWATDNSAVQATVSQPASRIFSGVLSNSLLTISASAVAYAAPCAYFLGTNPAAYSLHTASASIYATCPVYVNTGLLNDYFGNLNVRALRVSGTASNSIVSGSFPAPYFNLPVMTDPLAYVTSPQFTACDPFLLNLPIISALMAPASNPRQLYPGTYCGGINIIDGYVNLNPGVYIVAGGMSWTGATVTGNGVTIFLTKGSIFPYGQFLMQQDIITQVHTTVTLTPPTTGATAGIVVFGDRNWVSTNPIGGPASNDIQVYASYIYGDGIWYVPALATNIQGTFGGGTSYWFNTTYGGIVTQRLYAYTANIHWFSDFSSLPGGNPYRPRGTLVQ